MTPRTRYWTAECRYPGKDRFLFHSPRMCVIADSELDAADKLQAIVAEEWAKIVPCPAPPLTAVIPGRLVMDDELAAALADERRNYA